MGGCFVGNLYYADKSLGTISFDVYWRRIFHPRKIKVFSLVVCQQVWSVRVCVCVCGLGEIRMGPSIRMFGTRRTIYCVLEESRKLPRRLYTSSPTIYAFWPTQKPHKSRTLRVSHHCRHFPPKTPRRFPPYISAPHKLIIVFPVKCLCRSLSTLRVRWMEMRFSLFLSAISSFPRIINVNTSHKIIVLIAFFIVMFSNFLCHINLEAVCVRLMRNWVNFVRERIVFALEYFNSFYNVSFYLLEQSNHKPYYLCRFFSLSIKKRHFSFLKTQFVQSLLNSSLFIYTNWIYIFHLHWS